MMSVQARLAASLGLSLAFFTVYFLTANQVFSFDSLTNAIACESGQPARWFHSNHIFYPFLGVLYFKFERLLGYTGYSIYSLERFNSLLVSAGLGVYTWALSKILGMGRGVLMAAFLGSTYAVWNFAVDGRAVGASFFFSLLMIAALLQFSDIKDIPVTIAPFLSVLSAVFVFTHGIAIFHVPAVCWWLYLKTRTIRLPAVYFLIFTALGFITYGALYTWVVSPFHDVPFKQWVIGYAAYKNPSDIFSSPYWAHEASIFAEGFWRGWARSFLAPGSARHGLLASHAVGAVVLISVALALFNLKKLAHEQKDLIKILLLWTGLVALFIGFWSPGQEGFRLHLLAPLATVTALAVKNRRSAWLFLSVVTAVLFAANLSWSFYPASFIQNNPGYRMMSEIRSHLKPNDLLLAGAGEAVPGVEVLRPYFFPEIQGGSLGGWLYANHETDLLKLQARLRNQEGQGRSLYFTGDLFEGELQQRLETAFGLGRGSVETFLDGFKIVEEIKLSTGQKMFHVCSSVLCDI